MDLIVSVLLSLLIYFTRIEGHIIKYYFDFNKSMR